MDIIVSGNNNDYIQLHAPTEIISKKLDGVIAQLERLKLDKESLYEQKKANLLNLLSKIQARGENYSQNSVCYALSN